MNKTVNVMIIFQSNCFVIILPGDFNVKCYKIYIKLTDLLLNLYKIIHRT